MFKGLKLDYNLPKEVRDPLRQIDEYLTRQNGGSTVRPIVASPSPTKPAPGSTGPTIYQVISQGGDISYIPPQPFGTTLVLRFTSTPTLKAHTGNLKLLADFTPVSERELITLVSDGSDWHAIAAPSSARGLRINVLDKGAVADGVTDDSGAFNAAVAALPDTGGTIYVPWYNTGTYLLSSDFVINKSNVSVEIDAGVIISRDANGASVRAAIKVQGTEDLSSVQNLTANTGPYAIDLPVGASAGFAVGDWVLIVDDKVAQVAVPAEAIHCEINRVDSKPNATTIRLEYPLHDSYTTALTARVHKCSPVVGTRITGGGQIRNSTGTTTGGHGLYLYYAVDTVVGGSLDFNAVFNSCVHAARCSGISIWPGTVFRDPPRLDSKGYGFTCYSTWDVTLFGVQGFKLRHAVDPQAWSGKIAAVGCTLTGCALAPLNTHSNVQQVVYADNLIDGVHGQSADGLGYWTGGGGDVDDGHGINIDQANTNILVQGNIIRNVIGTGVSVDPAKSDFITIHDNDISGFNQNNNTTRAGIVARMPAATSDAAWATRTNYAITNNRVWAGKRFGILASTNHALVQGNTVSYVDDGGGVGIGIWVRTANQSCVGVAIKNNYCHHNVQDGIRVGDGSSFPAIAIRTVVEGNVCYSNTGMGIFVEDTSTNTRVLSNECSVNGADGINIQGDDSLVKGNTCDSNADAGIRIANLADATAVGENWLVNNPDGPIVDASLSTKSGWMVTRDAALNRVWMSDATGLGTWQSSINAGHYEPVTNGNATTPPELVFDSSGDVVMAFVGA